MNRLRNSIASALLTFPLLLATATTAQVNYTPYVFTTLAGRGGVAGKQDGQGTNALFNAVLNLAVDNAGNVYVCDARNRQIRKVIPLVTDWYVDSVPRSLR